MIRLRGQRPRRGELHPTPGCQTRAWRSLERQKGQRRCRPSAYVSRQAFASSSHCRHHRSPPLFSSLSPPLPPPPLFGWFGWSSLVLNSPVFLSINSSPAPLVSSCRSRKELRGDSWVQTGRKERQHHRCTLRLP